MLQDEIPHWQWTFASGWKELIACEKIIMMSTFQSDRARYCAECLLKVRQVYDHFQVPRPNDVDTLRKIDANLMSWVTWL